MPLVACWQLLPVTAEGEKSENNEHIRLVSQVEQVPGSVA